MTSDGDLFEFFEVFAESDDLIGPFAMPGMANVVVEKWMRVDSAGDTYPRAEGIDSTSDIDSANRRIDSLGQKLTFCVI
jgi:hypothetical protein